MQQEILKEALHGEGKRYQKKSGSMQRNITKDKGKYLIMIKDSIHPVTQ